MKQFFNVFRYEFATTAKSKSFILTTILVMLLIAGGLSYPKISAQIKGEDAGGDTPQSTFADKKIAVNDTDAQTQAFFAAALPCTVDAVTLSEAALTEKVAAGEYDYALIFTAPLEYKFITQKIGMTDTAAMELDALVLAKYRAQTLASLGASEQQLVDFSAAQTKAEVITTVNDNTQSFGYAYALLMLLYMSLMIYGQIVAQSVATEKSSRAMELLITSAKPSALMFGKVLGVGSAGLMQLMAWLLSALAAYAFNKAEWADNMIVQAMFEGSASMIAYTVLFFLLGYLVYSFLYGALGSLASRLEDVASLTMPVTLLVAGMFMVSLYSMIFDFMDSPIVKVMSFFPLTAPMAMFIRILVNDAKAWEIVLSVGLLIGTTVGMGYLSAAIYRVGVLLYGKPPKITELFKLLKKSN